jgi:hypothetical protein
VRLAGEPLEAIDEDRIGTVVPVRQRTAGGVIKPPHLDGADEGTLGSAAHQRWASPCLAVEMQSPCTHIIPARGSGACTARRPRWWWLSSGLDLPSIFLVGSTTGVAGPTPQADFTF